MSDITFYTNPQSRGQIVRWALEEVAADYDTKVIEYGAPLKSADYLAINPMGKIPAIVHKGQVVTECAAICAYLAAVFPESKLGPTAEQQADYFRWMFFAAGPLESASTNHALGIEPSVEQQKMAGYGNRDLTVSTLDALFSGRDYVCGDSFTMADVYVGSHVDFGLMFGSMPETDNFKAYTARLHQRPNYQAAKAKDMALMPDAASD